MNHSGRRPAATGLTLVCFALKDEAAPFRKTMVAREDPAILITGIGRNNARQSLLKFLQTTSLRRVFTCGFAGGLNPKLHIGQVLFDTSDPNLLQALSRTEAVAASFVCLDHIATTSAEKQTLHATTRADAVEMESDVIQAICREQGIPCATVRAISDTAQEDLPLDFNALSNPDQSLNFGKLAWTILKSPGKVPALLKLQTRTKLAAANLASVLREVTQPN